MIFPAGVLLTPLHGLKYFAGVDCENILKQVGLAFRLCALDNYDKYPMQVSVRNGGVTEPVADGNPFPVFQIMSNELNTPKILKCPADTRRDQAASFANFSRSNISYFVNTDATADMPRAFLCGDRNIIASGRLAQPGILELTTNTLCDWDIKVHTEGWKCRLGNMVLVERAVGNIANTDGKVTRLRRAELNQALQSSGVATNRLLIP